MKYLIANPYAKFLLNFFQSSNSEGNKLTSSIIDLSFIFLMFLPLGLPALIIEMESSTGSASLITPWTIAFAGFLFLFLNKDYYHSQGVGKKLTGHVIINFKTRKPAGRIRCVVRNVTLVVSFIEIPFILLRAKRRIGDYIAKTEVIRTAPMTADQIIKEMDSYHGSISWLWLVTSVIFTAILWSIASLPKI